ncbi:MAG: hypothetical protein WD035_09105, partial [Balneolaceae bacterium]
VVEPIEDVWLMGIDANVYLPLKDADPDSPADPGNFTGSGNTGYNYVLTHKQHLLEWIEDVAERAEANNKTLLAFSHFPAVDFYNQARQKIEELWGEGNFQLRRIPSQKTSEALAATGLRIHVAGHMHMNDTGVSGHHHVNDTGVIRDEVTGNILFNVQVPSLAAYVPAYKIVHVRDDKDLIEVETVVIDKVPDFDTLFSHYLDEWKYLDSLGYERIWNREILHSSDYYQFTDWHIRELSRLRFLPREWPEDVRTMLTGLNGRDMMIASTLENSFPFAEFKKWAEVGSTDLKELTPEFSEEWEEAEQKAARLAENAGIRLSDLNNWNGTDLSVDFYRLRNADELALRDIPGERIEQYSLIAEALSNAGNPSLGEPLDQAGFHEVFQNRFKTIFEVMQLFSQDLPSDNFVINLKTGEIQTLTGEKNRIIVK